jgi:hypothetical protein
MALELAWLPRQVELCYQTEEKKAEKFFLRRKLGATKTT